MWFAQNLSASIEISLAKTLQFLDPSDKRIVSPSDHVSYAVMHGSVMARYMLWERTYKYSSDDWVCLLLTFFKLHLYYDVFVCVL